MSRSRRSYRPQIQALEDRDTPSTTPTTHVLDIVPPPSSSAPSHHILITQSACHAIDAHAVTDDSSRRFPPVIPSVSVWDARDCAIYASVPRRLRKPRLPEPSFRGSADGAAPEHADGS